MLLHVPCAGLGQYAHGNVPRQGGFSGPPCVNTRLPCLFPGAPGQFFPLISTMQLSHEREVLIEAVLIRVSSSKTMRRKTVIVEKYHH